MGGRFEIVFLGTGGPLPNADRCGPGNVVVAGDLHVLVDCGCSASASPTVFLATGDLRVEAFTVDHFPVVPAFGFRTRCGGRSVVFSGDTSKCDSVLEASTGTDMLVCEALNVTMLRRMIEALKPNAPLQAGNLEDVPSYHISTLEVAELARDAGVGQVMLTHRLPTIARQDCRTSSAAWSWDPATRSASSRYWSALCTSMGCAIWGR